MTPVIDPVSLGFYAVVCALLAGYMPMILPRVVRLLIGAAVGAAAAAYLPELRVLAGL